ncbi:MAG: hypothetical protein JW940_04230 [Polyangiaceae bacterium]|nr:hypothetical protein [Polyangiaceae bacterium]
MTRWLAALLGLLVITGCGKSNDRPHSAPAINSTSGRSSHDLGGAAGSAEASQGGLGQAGSAEGGASVGDAGGPLGEAGGNPTQPEGGSGGALLGAGGASGQAGFAGASSESSAPPPHVTIRSPTSVDQLGDGAPVTIGDLEVVCRASKADDPGAQDVSPSSVNVVLIDAGGMEHTASAVTPSDENEDEYTTSLAIGEDVTPGRAEIRCTAQDSSAPPASGSASAFVYIDFGPTIDIDSPAEAAVKSVKQPVRFQYQISAEPLETKDPDAEVASARLIIGGQSFELQEDPKEAGSYWAEINFTDPTVFSVPPTGTTDVRVQASNSRDPAITSEINYAFTLDGRPPVIKTTGPDDGAIVGGFVELRFTITDDLAGVDPNTIKLKIGSRVFNYESSWGDGPDYVFTFDSASPEFRAQVQLPVMITAADKAGNGNDDGLGASMVLYLDTTPPIVTLDPPTVREVKEKKEGDECSHVFDPLGTALSDHSDAYQVGLVRAMVWERMNEADGQHIFYSSATDESSVYVYLQPDPKVPLLVDSDEDGACDALDTGALDESHSFVRLAPIAATGASDFRSTALDDSEDRDPALDGFCVFGKETSAPDPLCHKSSDLTRIIGQKLWTQAGSTYATVVFGVGPIGGASCTGAEWELGALIPEDYEGWICVAARAQDNAGNVGVSRPLRLCFDRTDPAHPGTPACDKVPTCTDGCSVPSADEFPQDTLDFPDANRFILL